MKRMYALLLFFLFLQLNAYVLRQMLILSDSPMADRGEAIDPEEFREEFDPTGTVSKWSSFTGMLSYVGDVVFGLFEMIGEVGVFIVAFPYFLDMIGVPSVWQAVLDVIWLFIISWGIWEWISGREAQK